MVSFDWSNSTDAIDNGSILEEKSCLMDLGFYIISASAKTASICSMKFLSPEVVLYLYKSII